MLRSPGDGSVVSFGVGNFHAYGVREVNGPGCHDIKLGSEAFRDAG